VARVTPGASATGTLTWNGTTYPLGTFLGAEPAFGEIRNPAVKRGRLLSGLVGTVIGVGLGQLRIAAVQPQVSPGSVVLSLGVSVLIGIFFGAYPATRAAALTPHRRPALRIGRAGRIGQFSRQMNHSEPARAWARPLNKGRACLRDLTSATRLGSTGEVPLRRSVVGVPWGLRGGELSGT
jgi:hypothetical protein